MMEEEKALAEFNEFQRDFLKCIETVMPYYIPIDKVKKKHKTY